MIGANEIFAYKLRETLDRDLYKVNSMILDLSSSHIVTTFLWGKAQAVK
jgi:hypothetical protein